MPVYPCWRCDQLVDTHSDVYCRNCAEKHPFVCSKCEKKINQADIYQLERLKTKKPLLCNECGYETEVVECGICKRTLVRSQGKMVGGTPDSKVYHQDCYNKQMGTVAFLVKLSPVFVLAGLLSGFFVASRTHSILVEMIASAGLGFVLFAMVQMLKVIITPK